MQTNSLYKRKIRNVLSVLFQKVFVLSELLNDILKSLIRNVLCVLFDQIFVLFVLLENVFKGIMIICVNFRHNT